MSEAANRIKEIMSKAENKANRNFKYLVTVFLYFVFIVYTLEILSSIVIVENKVSQDHVVLEQQKQKIKGFDLRSDFEAFIEEKKKIDLHPIFRMNQNYFFDHDLNTYFKNIILNSFNEKKKNSFQGSN